MNLFVIRNIAVKKNKHHDFLDKLKEHYKILAVKDIPFVTRWKHRKKMRGGKWRRGGYPVLAVVVYDPEPIENTGDVHRFVLNGRQFVKVEWRDWFTKETGARASANPIHSTDNEAEALAHLPLFFSSEEEQDILNKLSEIRSSNA